MHALKHLFAIFLAFAMVTAACAPAEPDVNMTPLSPAEVTATETESPRATADSSDEAYSYIVNGNDKLPKLMRLYGKQTVLTLVAYDLAGNEILRINDVYHKATNLNELLGAGEYKLLFYDQGGTLLTPNQEVGETLIIKGDAKASTNQSSRTTDTQVMDGYTTTKIAYADDDSITLQLNLIRPASGGPFPVIVWIHGGGFGPGGLNAAQGFEDDFTGRGYAIAAVAYRSMLDGYFPSQIQDVKGAIRYLRANAPELNLDPDAIYILGTSSGGLLASLVGMTSGMPEFEGTTGGNADVSSRVAGVINLFGSVTRAQINDLSADILPTTYQIFGCEVNGDCPDRYNLAVDNYVTAGDPPILIIHGTEDKTVPFQESVELAQILTAANVPTTFIAAEGFGHDKNGIITTYFADILSFLEGTR
ncbi:MAG: hypothetical protein HFACDABA_01854 [Anaerolineales bacterium]|nr:hypothetical protein [Anaerolineales bacterium]